MPPENDPQVSMLRHTLATVAYRGGKTMRGAPASFANFRVGDSTRTPGEILAHIGDLYDWALALAQGRHEWHSSTPLPWDEEVKRFTAHWELSMAILLPACRLVALSKNCFKDRWRIRSRILVKSRC